MIVVAIFLFVLIIVLVINSLKKPGIGIPKLTGAAIIESTFAPSIAEESSKWDVQYDNKTKAPKKLIGKNVDFVTSQIAALDIQEQSQVMNTLAVRFLDKNKDFLKVDTANLNLGIQFSDAPLYEQQNSGLNVITYSQTYKGLNVSGSLVNLVVNNGKLVKLDNIYYPDIDISIDPGISSDEAVQVVKDYLKFSDFNAETELLIFPEETNKRIIYHLAWQITTPLISRPFGSWVFIVDANDGKILKYYNQLKDLDGTITGEVYKDGVNILNPLPDFLMDVNISNEHLSIVRAGINISSTVTDQNGFYNFTDINLDGTETLVTTLTGPYAEVISPYSSQISRNLAGAPLFLNFFWKFEDASPNKENTHLFYHVNKIHDFFTRGNSFNITSMNFPIKIILKDVVDCNAYSGFDRIFFYKPDLSCGNLVLSNDIIYHEYTHSVIDHIYLDGLPYDCRGGGMGASMHEGLSDYFAATINNNSCVAEGFAGSVCLRNSENNLKFINQNYKLECHDGGEIFSGALWDARKTLSKNFTDNLVIRAIKLQPYSFQDFVEAMLLVDDDNANLEDGTPHSIDICKSFEGHGIYSSHCPITELKNISLTSSPGYSINGLFFNITSNVTCAGTCGDVNATLFYWKGTNFIDLNETKNWTAEGLWHSGDGATWIYNDPLTNTYDTGSRTFGGLTSGTIDLSDQVKASLIFNSIFDTELVSSADKKFVQISVNDGPFENLVQIVGEPLVPDYYNLDLGKYVGNKVRIKFFFDSIDEMFNNYGGWRISSVKIRTRPGSQINQQNPPIYTISPNPQICYGMKNNDKCTVTWIVNASFNDGDILLYHPLVRYNSLTYPDNSLLKKEVDDGLYFYTYKDWPSITSQKQFYVKNEVTNISAQNRCEGACPAENFTLYEDLNISAKYTMTELSQFDWIEINETGIRLALTDDEAVLVPIGFEFNFFDTQPNEIFISSNGLLGFNNVNIEEFYNTPIKINASPNRFIAPFWDDLDPTNFGAVYYKSLNDSFIVEWQNVPHATRSTYAYETITFEAVIKKTGEIVFNYKDAMFNNSLLDYGANATVGLKNFDETEGLQFSYNTPSLRDEESIIFTPLISVIPLPSISGTPFYVIGQNFKQCPELKNGEKCEVSWAINSTGNIGDSFNLFPGYVGYPYFIGAKTSATIAPEIPPLAFFDITPKTGDLDTVFNVTAAFLATENTFGATTQITVPNARVLYGNSGAASNELEPVAYLDLKTDMSTYTVQIDFPNGTDLKSSEGQPIVLLGKEYTLGTGNEISASRLTLYSSIVDQVFLIGKATAVNLGGTYVSVEIVSVDNQANTSLIKINGAPLTVYENVAYNIVGQRVIVKDIMTEGTFGVRLMLGSKKVVLENDNPIIKDGISIDGTFVEINSMNGKISAIKINVTPYSVPPYTPILKEGLSFVDPVFGTFRWLFMESYYNNFNISNDDILLVRSRISLYNTYNTEDTLTLEFTNKQNKKYKVDVLKGYLNNSTTPLLIMNNGDLIKIGDSIVLGESENQRILKFVSFVNESNITSVKVRDLSDSSEISWNYQGNSGTLIYDAVSYSFSVVENSGINITRGLTNTIYTDSNFAIILPKQNENKIIIEERTNYSTGKIHDTGIITIPLSYLYNRTFGKDLLVEIPTYTNITESKTGISFGTVSGYNSRAMTPYGTIISYDSGIDTSNATLFTSSEQMVFAIALYTTGSQFVDIQNEDGLLYYNVPLNEVLPLINNSMLPVALKKGYTNKISYLDLHILPFEEKEKDNPLLYSTVGRSISGIMAPSESGYYKSFKPSFEEFKEGNYYASLWIVDSLGNLREKRSAVIPIFKKAESAYTNDTVQFFQDMPTIINASKEGVELSIETNVSTTGLVSVVKLSENPENINATNTKQLGKFVKVNVENSTNNQIENAVMKIFYNDLEISQANLNESTLRIYKFNSTDWILLLGGVNTEQNYVYSNLTNFSTFGVFGQESQAPAPAPSAPSGGGGGGGGGGVSAGPAAPKTIVQLKSNETKTLYLNILESLDFNVSGEKHKLKFAYVRETPITRVVTFEFNSSVKQVNMTLNDIRQVDVNDDSVADFEIVLTKFVSSTYIEFTLKSLEAKPQVQQAVAVQQVQPETETVKTATVEAPKPTTSCTDGIQNQGEEGIDCGGPCAVCREAKAPALEKPAVKPKEKSSYVVLFSVFAVVVIAVALLVLVMKKKRRVAEQPKKIEEAKPVEEHKPAEKKIAKEQIAKGKKRIGQDKNKQLADYIKKQRAKKKSDEEIKKALLEVGWTEKTIGEQMKR